MYQNLIDNQPMPIKYLYVIDKFFSLFRVLEEKLPR